MLLFGMRTWFRPNLDRRGRLFRGALGLALLGAAVYIYPTAAWAALILVLIAAFTLFEAFRGWCAMRACGIKTKL